MRAGWIVLGLICQTLLGAERVGDWGDPGRIHFEGLASFSPDDIRAGLLRHPDYLVVSHPAASFERYPRALNEMIRLGFLAAGFARPEVEVRVDRDRQRLAVRVVEGPRYRCGKVRVLGARELPADALIRRLIEKPGTALGGLVATDDRPLWVKDAHPGFDQVADSVRSQVVTNLLPEFGFFLSNTRVRLELDDGRGEADLVIEILDEGPRGRIGSIAAEGNLRSEGPAVIEAAGLSVGMALDQSLLRRAEERLWESARFLGHRIDLLLEEGAPDARVVITVREHAAIRPLGEAWSAAEEAALRFRDWLASFPERGDDLVITVSNAVLSAGWVQFTVSNDGFMILLRSNAGAPLSGLIHAAWFSPGEVGLMSATQRKRLEFRPPTGQLTSYLSLLPSPDPDRDKPFELQLGAGFRSGGSEVPGNRTSLALRLAPVAFLGELHREGTTASIDAGELRVRSGQLNIRVDAATGRLLAGNYETGGKQILIEVRPGVFRQTRDELLRIGSGFARLNDPGRAVTALARYGFAELALGPYFGDTAQRGAAGQEERRKAEAAVWEKIMSGGALANLDDLVAGLGAEHTNAFSIPIDPRATADPMAGLMAAMAAYVFQLSNDLFPKRSWPWTVAREAVFVAMGRGEFTGEELYRLSTGSEMGPLGFLAVAKLLSVADQPGASSFAVGGLTRLGASHFQQDWRLLVEGPPALGKTAEQLGAAVAALGAEELSVLARMMGEEDARALTAVIEPLRAGPPQPSPASMQPLGEFIWERLLKERVRAELRKLVK